MTFRRAARTVAGLLLGAVCLDLLTSDCDPLSDLAGGTAVVEVAAHGGEPAAQPPCFCCAQSEAAATVTPALGSELTLPLLSGGEGRPLAGVCPHPYRPPLPLDC
jgi:hypothetical protein